MAIGASGAEPFWTEFLRDLVRRGISGVKLMISDAHKGIKAATAQVLSTTWQRCWVHFQRNALGHAGKSSRRVANTEERRIEELHINQPHQRDVMVRFTLGRVI